MAEDYVRPPIVAVEPSHAARVWRFRIVMTIVVLAVAAALAILLHHFVGGGEGGTTVGLSATVALSRSAAPTR